MSEIESYLEAERAVVNATLAALLDGLLGDAPSALDRPIRYAVEAGGKRLRPILCVAAYRAAGGREVPGIYGVACSLELIHTYSLVHDDLPCMDDDDLRRGQATVHRRFGERSAVLAGGAMIGLAARALLHGARDLDLAAGVRIAMVETLCAAAGAEGMVGGQLRDLEAEGRGGIGLGALESIHRAKTGALLAAGPRLGGMAAGASPGVVDALEAFGRSLGLAFQVADDVLDVTGTATDLGKAAGRDQALGKATYPALLGVDGALRRAAEEADRAVEVLRGAGIEAPRLEALAAYAVHRTR